MEKSSEDRLQDADLVSTAMTKAKLNVQWAEGKEEDFAELHEAIASGNATKYSANDSGADEADESSQSSEVPGQKNFSNGSDSDDEPEVEPSPDDHGPRFLWASQHGLLDELERLYSVDNSLIHFKDSDGYTALHRASYSHQPDVALFLLKHGADIHATSLEDWNPLHSACRWNAFSCVEILLAWGADVNALTHGGQTPLHLAAFCGKSRETLQLLLTHPKIQSGVKNCQQDTPKDIALRNNNCVGLFDLVEPFFTDV